MTIEECIHKLDFSIGAYQKLINENVANGEVVGTGVRGTWTANTPLNKAYSDMIEALQTAKDTMRKYRLMQADYENRLKADLVAILEELDLQIDESAAYNLEVAKVQWLIREKINALKAESEPQESEDKE
ncbi:MAG: hypothetical protein J5521_04500 [Lachnospiraceae bacterium]|nr:hypothetical protein [Lachnospiraceae bacterium]MBR4414789.1 hypothetical protein [Aeriscardovia sp.]